MGNRLPPLTALHTFEAAARHLSFTKAAEELFVTQAAVSHQIKTLEEHLGVRLFRRLNRRLMLTDQGQALMPWVRDGFGALARGVATVRDQCDSGVLSISVMPTFASKWLVARLGRFHALHPDIEIRLTTTPRLVDLEREEFDAAIRYGEGYWPGLRAERLMCAELFPVTGPKLLAGPKPLGEPAHLAEHTLLHVLDNMDDWRLWLRAAGVDGVDPERGLKFDTLALALDAAANGAGVAIGSAQLVADDLAAGHLIRLFDFDLPSVCAYYWVTPEATTDHPKVRAFRDWLFGEAGTSAAPAGIGEASRP